jgi:N12 class adenine-specific DNA methylase
MILERTSTTDIKGISRQVMSARNLGDITSILRNIFDLNGTPVADPQGYKSGNSDYGLRVRGVKARERINDAVRDILTQVDDPEELTDDQRDMLLQYSGRGGTSDNSQYEYYTPTHVAEGVWDAMRENGFVNGNVLDPCTGSGIFSGTKPEGSIITGNDLDPVGSKVAALLNPEDQISNTPFEKIAVDTPDNTFDAVVGNVPFGNARGKSAHIDRAYKKERLIERYFLQRVLDKVKPGGLCCLVVPINIVGQTGKKWEQFRMEVSRKAEFLGAHKLPSKTFGAQGTDTVVDVIVLKKHPEDLLEKINDLDAQVLWDASVYFKEFIKGKYWQGEGRRFIMGKYTPKVPGDRWSRETVDGDVDNEGLKRKLAQKFSSRIAWDELDAAEPRPIAYADGDRRMIGGTMYELAGGQWQPVDERQEAVEISREAFGAESLEELEGLLQSAEGRLSLNFEQADNIAQNYPGTMPEELRAAHEFASRQPEEMRGQIMRGTLIGGMIARAQNAFDQGEDVTAELERIKAYITEDIERHGLPSNNKKLRLSGADAKMYMRFMSAVDAEGNFSDFLKGERERTGSGQAYNTNDPEAIVSHLFVREDRDFVELDDIAERYTGEREIKDLGDLAEFPGIAVDPVSGTALPMDKYCVGDAYGKVAKLQEAIADTDDQRLKARFQEQIDELMRRVNPVSSERITFGLKQRWFNPEYLVEFLKEQGYEGVQYGKPSVEFVEDYAGNMRERETFITPYDGPDGEFRGLRGRFTEELQKYLNGGKIGNRKDDSDLHHERTRMLEEQFNSWMKQRADIDEIVAEYNRRFNGHIPAEYSDEDLGIDEYLGEEIKLHGYQNAEIRRLSEEGRGICGFNVGLGKSFVSLGLTAFNLKKGRSKRTCIVVPKNTLENWYHEARAIYSESFMRSSVHVIGVQPVAGKGGKVKRVPVLDERGEPVVKGGKQIFRDEIKVKLGANDKLDELWSALQSNAKLIVMHRDLFGRIPIMDTTVDEYAGNMTMDALKDKNGVPFGKKKGKSYDEDKQKAKLEQRFSDTGTEKRDEYPYFEEFGFDNVILDEVHDYRNAFTPGRGTADMHYLPTGSTSQRALDIHVKTDYLRRKFGNRGVIGLSATPIVNSPFEIYSQLSMVCDKSDFERMGVYSVDQFVDIFGKVEQVDKLKLSGKIDSGPGLVGFQNLDALRGMFNKYVNLKSAEDVESEIHVPEGKRQPVEVELSEEQQVAYEELRARAAKSADPATPAEEKEHVFSLIREMDRVTTDMDLYRRTMSFVLPSKYRKAVEDLEKKLPETYTATEKDEETGEKVKVQVSFTASYRDHGSTFTFVVPESYESLVVAHFEDFGIVESEVAHPISPKYAAMLDKVRTDYESGGKVIIFTEEKTQHRKLQRIITNHLGVPAKEIGIINAAEIKGDDMDKIGAAFNTGKLRVVIANRKAEVGINLQKGTTSIIHLTLPLVPASFIQREGRAVRQGNVNESVDIVEINAKGSFDAYRKDILRAKSNWLNELMTGEDATAKNQNVEDVSELLELLAENPEEAKRIHKERLGKEKAKREERRKADTINKLKLVANAEKALENMDSTKEAERQKLADKIAQANTGIAQAKKRLEKDPDSDTAKRKLKFSEKQLKASTEKLNTIDVRYKDMEKTLQQRIKQTKGYLRQKHEAGELPFDASLIEKTDSFVADAKGNVYAEGDTYELHEVNRYGNREKQFAGVLKVKAVHPDSKEIEFDFLVGSPSYDMRDRVRVASLDSGGKILQKCSYSEKELALKRLEAKGDVQYEKLPDLGVDKQLFAESYDTIKSRVRGPLVYEDNNGDVQIGYAYEEPEFEGRLLYPDIQNEQFQKRVFTRYLQIRRRSDEEGVNPPFEVRNTLQKLYGYSFEAKAEEYGEKATEQQIREAVADAWTEYVARNVGDDVTMHEYLQKEWYSATKEIAGQVSSIGDNTAEIKRFVDEFISIKKREAREEHEAQLAAERKKEEAEEQVRIEKLKEKGEYAEIPQEIAEKYNGIGVKLFVNTVAFGGYEPYSRYMLTDERFGGLSKQFFAGRKNQSHKDEWEATGTKQWPERDGFWWHIPTDKDLNALYELLS